MFAYGGLRSGLIGLEVRGPAFGLEAKPKARTNSRAETMKLPGQRPGLPGSAVSFYVVPLDPARSVGLAEHVPASILAEIKAH